MNDPHVVALIYRVEHDQSVSYSEAPPLTHDDPRFCITIRNGEATFKMNVHCDTAEAARDVVEPLIRAWEMDVYLKRGSGEFALSFNRAEIKDREPTPGVVAFAATMKSTSRMTASLSVGRGRYPAPPGGLSVTTDVQSMYERYSAYRQDKEPLAPMAYFCLTVLEDSTGIKKGPRAEAAKRYGIDLAVLKLLGQLTAEKGGRGARKARGVSDDFTSEEVRWIEAAVKAFIRRAGEFAHTPGGSHTTITMADLPQL